MTAPSFESDALASAAYAVNGTAVAAERFYQLACDPHRNVVVEACAGAGKTWMLVSRMLRALLSGSQAHEILAITFTKKAAAEMRERLVDWLGDLGQSTDAQAVDFLMQRGIPQPSAEQVDLLRSLHSRLLKGGRPVQVRTFHSWFAAIAASAPMGVLSQLGLPTQYELLEDDKRATPLVWRRFYASVVADETAHLDYTSLVSQFGRSQVQKALANALQKRVEFFMADAANVVENSVSPAGALFPVFANFSQPLDSLFTLRTQELLGQAAKALGGASQPSFIKLGQALEQALTDKNAEAIFSALFTKTGSVRKFQNFSQVERVYAAQAELEHIQAAQVQHDAWLYQQRMARLTRILIADYAALKRERGWLDMNDLERLALVLMSNPLLSGWIQEKLDAQVRHLLIDEFQDTSPMQWQALRHWLEGYSGAGTSPSVFIVGDPKQSIYRFRRAEPRVFKAAKAFITEALQGVLLSCDHTRRNRPGVLLVVNSVMNSVQSQGRYADFRTHTTANQGQAHIWALPQVSRPEKSKKPVAAVWRDSLTSPRFEAEDNRKVQECRQAAHWIADTLATDPNHAGKVIVLSRKREHLGLMQVELTTLGVPTEQPEKIELAEATEVKDVLALMDVLVSPRHDLSFAQALKSPILGITDAQLVQWAAYMRTLPKNTAWLDALFAAAIPDFSMGNTTDTVIAPPSELLALAPVLQTWRQWLFALPPHDALAKIFAQGDIFARYAAATPVAQRLTVLANLQAFLGAALELDGGRFVSAYRFIRTLRAGGVIAPIQAQSNVVRLLTVHGAKGLEAGVVVLLDTDGEKKKTETMGILVQWPGEASHPEQFVFLASESQPPHAAQALIGEDLAEQAREEINSLYVALTRAEHTLVLSSSEPHTAQPNSWWQQLLPHAVMTGVDADLPNVILQATNPVINPSSFELKALPRLTATLNLSEKTTALVQAPEPLSAEARIGQAMHRLLERIPIQHTTQAEPWNVQDVDHVAVEFALNPIQVDAAHAMALAIVRGEGAWVWNKNLLRWYGNEVTITVQGRSLRIDRLVQTQKEGEWWVIDYKTASNPDRDDALLHQLKEYRDAVAKANPQQRVRAAFLTGSGLFIEAFAPTP